MTERTRQRIDKIDKLEAEIARLRKLNAELVAGCEQAAGSITVHLRLHESLALRCARQMLRGLIAEAKEARR